MVGYFSGEHGLSVKDKVPNNKVIPMTTIRPSFEDEGSTIPTLQSCEEAQALFGDYFDEELADSVRMSLQRHFESCKGCFEQYQAYTVAPLLARELREESLDHGVRNRLRQKLSSSLGVNFTQFE